MEPLTRADKFAMNETLNTWLVPVYYAYNLVPFSTASSKTFSTQTRIHAENAGIIA